MASHEGALSEPVDVIFSSPAIMRIYITYQSVLFGIVVWDYLVCLRQEHRFIWQARISFTKVLYLLSRYVCLALTIAVFALNYIERPLSECAMLVRCNCAAITLIQAISLAVLAQRAYLVSLKSKKVLIVMALFIVATLTMGVWHAVSAVTAASDTAIYGICWAVVHDHWRTFTAIFFAIPLVGHFIATAVVLYHARKHLPHNDSLRRLLMVDGVLYLLAVDTVALVQVLFFILSKRHIISMMNAASLLSLTSVFCCRFMLHTRSSAQKLPAPGSNPSDSPPDWTNNWSKPSSMPSSRIPVFANTSLLSSSRHQLSRLSDEGAAKVDDIPDFELNYFLEQRTHTPPIPRAPRISVEHTVIQVIDSEAGPSAAKEVCIPITEK